MTERDSREGPAPAGDPSPGPAAPAARGGRILLAALGLYAALVLVAAWAQLTDNRVVLDLFDLRRWFTR
ncbi:MAG: hypothetical protein HUU06_14085 [Planctomycetaceae bacterium]|nr:hypothetical protein [Planctomycetaceae bacterium]